MSLVLTPGAPHSTADFDLDPRVLASLWKMEENHFWHAARNRWILHGLAAAGAPAPASVMDVGCGAGWVTTAMQHHGYQVTGVDTAEPLVRKAHQRCPDATFVRGRVEDVPEELGPFDVVAFFDVLEHVDEPLTLVRAALQHASPRALVAVTVPALAELFSVVDRLSGHKKRYELGELASLLRACGLVAIEERGIFRCIGPLMRLRRTTGRGGYPFGEESRRRILLEDTRIPPFLINEILKVMCEAELKLGYTSALGKSAPTLFAVGRLPKHPK